MLETLNLEFILPELILSCGAMALLMMGVATKRERGELVLWLAILIIGAARVFVARGEGTATLFSGSFIVDPYARVLKLLTLTGAAAALLCRSTIGAGQGGCEFEFPVLVLLATLGMMMMISANDLIALYVGLELQSLALYVVAAFKRDIRALDRSRPEIFRPRRAVLRHAALRRLAGLWLYRHHRLRRRSPLRVQPSGANLGLVFGLVFLLAGLAFKISAVPFHMWTPDVYEGAPTPVTAFFAAAPKVAAMALIVRVADRRFPAGAVDWQQIVVFISIASMALGSFAAIGQTNIKRLMAYSSIGHMGYALVGLAAGTPGRARRRSSICDLSGHDARHLRLHPRHAARRRIVEDIDDLAGLVATNPVMAMMLTILMFSLAGIPPLAGFFAKWYVFLAAINAGLYALAVIGVLLGGRRLLLSAHRQDHVVRRAGRAASSRWPAKLRLLGGLRLAFVLFYVYRRRWSAPSRSRRQDLF